MLLLLLVGMARGLWAAEPRTIDEYVAAALKNNPEIAQAEADWHAAEARVSPAKTLPDPMIGLDYMNMGSAPSLGSDMNTLFGVSYSQMVPGRGKLPLEGQVMQAEADRLRTAVDVKRWDLHARVEKTYYGLYHTDRMLGILGEIRTLLESMEKNMEAMYGVGMAPQQDVLKAQVALSKLSADELDLKLQRSQLEIEMNTLLAHPASTPIHDLQVMEEMHWKYTLDDLDEMALATSPELRMEQQMIGVEGLRIERAKAEYHPDTTWTYSLYTRGHFGPAWQVMAERTLPIYRKKKQDFGVIEAERSNDAAQKSYEVKRNDVFQGLDSSLATLHTSLDQYTLLNDNLVPQAELTFLASLSAYQVGKADFLTALDALMNLYDFKMRVHTSLEMFHREAADIETMVGAPLHIHEPASGESMENMPGMGTGSKDSGGGSHESK